MRINIAFTWYQFFLVVPLIFLPGCVHRRHIDRQKLYINLTAKNNHIPTNAPPSITIWIHGTLMFYIPIYHQIFDGKSGLMHMKSLPENHHFRVLAETISQHDPEHFPMEEFYIFSWSGKLKQQERENAAAKLHEEIIILQEQYQKKYGIAPTIRIIAHSHGGNVAINMACLRSSFAKAPEDPRKASKNISFLPGSPSKETVDGVNIKSLILLACPVQEKTMHLIGTPMFNRVYSLYSSFDFIQVLAPQFRRLRASYERTLKRRKYHYKFIPFSARLFPTYSHLTQAKIKINDYPISHTRFSTKEFTVLLPIILEKLDIWHDESLAMNKITKHKLLCIYK